MKSTRLALALLPFATAWGAAPAQDTPDLAELAARCGSEVDWAEDWSEARQRSKREDRPILLTARRYRGFQLSDDRMSGEFMDPDVIALVNERFVPFDMKELDDTPLNDPARYGMSGTTFGQAVLIVDREGQVAVEGPRATYDFLREALAQMDERAPEPRASDRVERAATWLARGEHERAAKLLARPQTAAEHRLLAQLARRERRGEDALAHLADARDAKGFEAEATDVHIDESVIFMRVGRPLEARALLTRVVREASHPRLPEARFLLGAVELHLEGKDAAEERWRSLVREHPDSRWAWKAAATLTSTAWTIGVARRIDWPDELEYDGMRVPAFAEKAVPVARAKRDAVDWLLAAQREDGSWFSPTAFGALDSAPADEFELAITAICIRALLPHAKDRDVSGAVDAAGQWLQAAYLDRRKAELEPAFMDYAVWSRAAMIEALAALVEAERLELEHAAPIVSMIVDDLRERQRENGGWSYFLTTDVDQAGAAGEQSISFTTAAAVLALLRGQDVGFPIPDDLVGSSVRCLEAMREPGGAFKYMLFADGRPTGATGVPGSAGRGPLCSLALYRAGRLEEGDVRRALGTFVANRAGYASELGKVLMHTGGDGQGSHYLLFDYAHAAFAAAELGRKDRVRYGEAVLEETMRARCVDGSFRDNVSRGMAYGTAMALMGLEALSGR